MLGALCTVSLCLAFLGIARRGQFLAAHPGAFLAPGSADSFLPLISKGFSPVPPQEQAVGTSMITTTKGFTESDEERADSTHAPLTKDRKTMLYLPLVHFQNLGGTDVAHVNISGRSESELDAVCHRRCAENDACEFWVRRAGTGRTISCWLKKDSVDPSAVDPSARGGFKATRISQPLDLGALRGKNVLIAGDSNDRNFVTSVCKWMGDQGLHVELVNVKAFHISNRSADLPELVQPRICHVKTLNASIVSAFHYGVATIAPASGLHKKFAEACNHLPYHKVVQNFERVHAPIFVSSDYISKELWPALVRDHLPRRPLHVVAQSSIWDSVPVVLDALKRKKHPGLASSPEEPEFAHAFMANYNWTDKASIFIAAIRRSLDATQIIWRTTAGCPFGNPISKVSQLQRKAIAEKITSGESPWEGVQLLDWAAHFDVKGGHSCDSKTERGVHYRPEGYWALFEQLVTVLSAK